MNDTECLKCPIMKHLKTDCFEKNKNKVGYCKEKIKSEQIWKEFIAYAKEKAEEVKKCTK